MSGLAAFGFLSLAIGAERSLGALLTQSNGSYLSIRMALAVACLAAASVFFALAARERGKPRRPRDPPSP
jgi:hypothetical protein